MRTIILTVVVFLFVLCLIPLIAVCFIFQWRAPLFFFGKGALNLARIVLGIKVDVIGREAVDRKKACIFMANHLSFIDGPLLFWLIPQSLRILLKKEIFRYPIIGLAMRLVGFVPVDRGGLRSGKKSIDRAAELIRERGYSFLIFPEGTRSRNGHIQPFRRGAFFLAVDSQAPVVPVSISGSFDLMPKGSLSTKRGRIKVIFHPEVPVQGLSKQDIPDLMKKIQDIIISGLSC
ncbi:lysophospholipid acyltransferase family protein [Acidobacteriota bacterium]